MEGVVDNSQMKKWSDSFKKACKKQKMTESVMTRD